ncbi:hypothetical protein OKW21_002603 [Catalinimonas alkaloidigena]|uniref:HARBI1 family protein n=1 Tax=Catalinimonas alkaloidigena TaxID=1075417 RepID=UPI0024055487|nr:transposase family protein [Catalinimonas alkaloidigena]MDF9796263.1 hypothetical protein [Catalinimonas alkaloidigena]MDF9796288.1 hypothetical protein [Catalinimonas alkaloidigena]MDF9796529.1 hypothetical protein [Catalinimonas alkaloidigena]MDF9797151.1 hypothetical protein [Catalinimonas alkaloidigena]MDF9797340.1 hypothetical protein [Catalinimonas alkaloidigena]
MDLLYHFAPIVEEHYRHHDMKGQRRKMVRYQERSDSSLTGPVNKLLFILSYMKENPNQAYHGVMFSMSQGKVSLWVNQLSFLLEEALKKMGKMPHREVNKFYNFLYAYVELVMFMDVVERRIGRSPDYQVQKDHYSGKKGCHTLKNLLIANLEGELIYLGETFEGSVHDKSMYDQAELKFPDHRIAERWHSLWVDLGFLGLKAEGVEVYMPEKKPKGKELSNFQKELNTLIASIRVKVEHAIAGVKRLKIIRNQVRIHGWQKRDRMMYIACGLHNLRCQRWAT